MAKESMKARERKRAAMIAKYAEKRARLKAEGEWEELQKLPKNSSSVMLVFFIVNYFSRISFFIKKYFLSYFNSISPFSIMFDYSTSGECNSLSL